MRNEVARSIDRKFIKSFNQLPVLKQFGFCTFQFLIMICLINQAIMCCVRVYSIFSTLLPKRQISGQSAIFTFRIYDKLQITFFQNLFTERQCHIRCINVSASPQPCQHKWERDLSIFFNLLGVIYALCKNFISYTFG